MKVSFIPLEVVLLIHKDLLKRYGGEEGLRDPALLESALAQPAATTRGRFLHKTIYDKAAAYGFHFCRNHPFVYGNKRVAFVVMVIFLQKNGMEINATEEEAYKLMIELAEGKMTKPRLSHWLKKNSSEL